MKELIKIITEQIDSVTSGKLILSEYDQSISDDIRINDIRIKIIVYHQHHHVVCSHDSLRPKHHNP